MAVGWINCKLFLLPFAFPLSSPHLCITSQLSLHLPFPLPNTQLESLEKHFPFPQGSLPTFRAFNSYFSRWRVSATPKPCQEKSSSPSSMAPIHPKHRLIIARTTGLGVIHLNANHWIAISWKSNALFIFAPPFLFTPEKHACLHNEWHVSQSLSKFPQCSPWYIVYGSVETLLRMLSEEKH